MNRYRMFFLQTSTRPPPHAPKVYQTWKQNNQLPTKSHDELKDNSNKLWNFSKHVAFEQKLQLWVKRFQ